MKRIVILTATRAEYGLLKPLMIRFGKDSEIDLKIAVTGMHLSPEFGLTVKEIEADNILIDKKIEILLSSDSPVAQSKAMGLAMISFSEYFDECKPDGIIVLGDRFETLAVSATALNARIPIFHIHGGETTEGALDEAIRHSITKMSYLHFASTEEYRKRIIQMGEDPERVYNVGALGVENALSIKCLSKNELEDSLNFSLGNNFALGTFHPVTLEDETAEYYSNELLKAIGLHDDITYLFTKANADIGGRKINKVFQEYSESHSNFHFVDSLGMVRYLSALKYADFIIGNSSSGIIEAPSFHIPTINIGDRQKGRISGDTVIHCEPNAVAIDKAIKTAEDQEFRTKIQNSINPYGEGKTSDRIVKIIKEYLFNDRIILKKKFYDIDF